MSDEILLQALKLIADERNRQNNKWGDQSQLHNGAWLAILIEEVGEVATEILEGDHRTNLQLELVQVAAVATAWVEKLLRERDDGGK